MQSAPAVVVKVRRSRFIAAGLVLIYSLDVLLTVAVLTHIAAGGLIRLSCAALYAGLALWLYLTYIRLFDGDLEWDGKVWTGQNKTSNFTGALFLMLDLQWLLVLKSESGVWLTLQASHYSQHDWLALRRAVFSAP